MGDLKPCPFCGSTDLRLNEFEQYGICNSCNAFGPSFDVVDERDALAAWNIRATPPEVTAMVDALRPFAEAAMHLHPATPSEATTLDGIEVGQWRAAYAALAAWEAANG